MQRENAENQNKEIKRKNYVTQEEMDWLERSNKDIIRKVAIKKTGENSINIAYELEYFNIVRK